MITGLVDTHAQLPEPEQCYYIFVKSEDAFSLLPGGKGS